MNQKTLNHKGHEVTRRKTVSAFV